MTDQDILVEMNVENVIMEGCRRIDEWELIFAQLGSLERLPHLAYDERVDERGEVTFTAEEWRVIVHVDGHADINTVLRECGLDRFHGAKVIYSLYSSGLVTVSDAVIDAIGQRLSVAVRGPIDLYNEIFLTTLTDSNVTKQLRVEIIDDKEVEIPIVAGMVPLASGAGKAASDEHAAGGESEALVFTASASSPEQAWKRLGGDSSAFVLLANANDVDSLRATRRDLDFVRAPRRRAHRSRHVRVVGRRPGRCRRGREGARAQRLDAHRLVSVARPRLGARRRRQGARARSLLRLRPPATAGARS